MRLKLILVALLALMLPVALIWAAPAADVTFTVDSVADLVDASIGDGACAASGGVCTLRAAIQEANVSGANVTIQLPANMYTLNRAGVDNTAVSGDLDISRTLTIAGAGAAMTIIDGNGNVTGDRVLDILSGTVTISGITIENGKPGGYGGGINVAPGAALELTDCAVSSNHSTGGGGGGIYVQYRASLSLLNCTVNNNSANTSLLGGGLFNSGGIVTATNSSFIGNTAGAGAGFAVNLGTLLLRDSTVWFNITPNDGGGIRTINLVTVTLVNSTLSGNVAYHHGGGISAGSNAQFSLFNSTVANNYADFDGDGVGDGGGLQVDAGSTVRLRNTIVGGNQDGSPLSPDQRPDCAGTVASNGYNLVQNVAGCAGFTGPGDQTGVNPMLGTLAANGGRTRTYALQPGSPAIDAGNPFGCTDELGRPLASDQRGLPRAIDDNFNGVVRCDIGAFEYGWLTLLPMIRR